MAVPHAKLLKVDEFLALPEEFEHYELWWGQIERKHVQHREASLVLQP